MPEAAIGQTLIVFAGGPEIVMDQPFEEVSRVLAMTFEAGEPALLQFEIAGVPVQVVPSQAMASASSSVWAHAIRPSFSLRHRGLLVQ